MTLPVGSDEHKIDASHSPEGLHGEEARHAAPPSRCWGWVSISGLFLTTTGLYG
jgi:hypothetical protein